MAFLGIRYKIQNTDHKIYWDKSTLDYEKQNSDFEKQGVFMRNPVLYSADLTPYVGFESFEIDFFIYQDNDKSIKGIMGKCIGLDMSP